MSPHDLPSKPHIDHLKNEAKALHKAFNAGNSIAMRRVRNILGDKPTLKLSEAQRVVAREYGFTTWAQLRAEVESTRVFQESVDEAASLTFALIRFAQGAAHPPRGSSWRDRPRLGEDEYLFTPSSRRLPRQDVPAFLASLPSPAFLLSTTIRGIVALHLLDELRGDRASSAKHELENQRENLEDMVRRLGLAAEAPVLVDLGDETRIVSVSALRLWTSRFVVDVGWNVSSLASDSRASAQLNLFRSDGAKLPVRPGDSWSAQAV